ncbi:MAG: cobalamin-binding protein [Bacteriovoracaceae bacterium]|nr:cobalamin-binding protein [Bacteriovoracaceae bacterium]
MKTRNRDIPQKIICLTEESVETLALLGRLDLVAGVSIFVKRPEEAQSLPKVSAFTNSKIEKIVELKPDLILGFSDIQKDIARDLIGAGQNVWIANQRSISEILDYILLLGRLVGEESKALALVEGFEQKIEEIKLSAKSLKFRPKVYFEEWDDPQISAIQWVSELIEICGGIDIFKDRSRGKLAAERFTKQEEILERNPDVIIGCWCGKKVRLESFKTRQGWSSISAVKNDLIFELEPEIFLQPGPALFVDGLEIMHNLIKEVALRA